MKPKNTAGVTSLITRPRTPAQDRSDALEAARTEAREARTQAAATHSWAEATNAQLRAMQALTDTALSHLALDDLLPELLGRVTAVMGVDAVGISLLDADGQTLTLRAARGLGEEDAGRVQIPVGLGFSGRIMASREPQIVDADALSGADFEGGDPILRERLHSVAGVPLLVEGPAEEQVEGREVSRLIGVLVVGSTLPNRFTEADVQLLQRAADRIAVAIDRARLYADELAAREASRRMEAFVATAAHDLRSPLTAVVGYIDLAKRQSERLAAAARETHPDLASGVEGVREHMADAGQSAKRLTRLLTLLFDMAAIRADRLELHREPCDLATLVREQVATPQSRSRPTPTASGRWSPTTSPMRSSTRPRISRSTSA